MGNLATETEYCKIYCEGNVCVVEATNSYIPITDFKEIFNKVEGFVRKSGINKLVFDKRQLKVFHQPSMEWYFIEWKERMFDLGLRQHRKILPKDPVFRECVKLGREKIYKLNPQKKFNMMDIQYANTIEEAIVN